MKRYTVSQVRERLAEALDRADQGEPVVIERKGVRYSLALEKPPAQRPRRRKSIITYMDPALESGEWSWDWSAVGPTFRDQRQKR